MGAGIGAAASVAASKIKLGARSEETRQAFISGYSDSKLGQVAFAESMKLLATYAFFGGALPLLNFAPDFVLAANGDFTGQLHGPGSVLSQLVSSMTERASQLVTSVSDTNLADGAAAFWDGWRASSPFAEAVHNGVTLPFSGPSEILSRVFQHSKEWDKIVELFNKLPSDGLAGGAISAGLMGLYSYMGAAGLYAVLSMNPAIAAGMKDKLPDNIDKWLFPGAYLGTGMAMVASGVKPLSALAFTLVCYAVQYRHHVQSGGDWRIFKPDVFKTLTFVKFTGQVRFSSIYRPRKCDKAGYATFPSQNRLDGVLVPPKANYLWQTSRGTWGSSCFSRRSEFSTRHSPASTSSRPQGEIC